MSHWLENKDKSVLNDEWISFHDDVTQKDVFLNDDIDITFKQETKKWIIFDRVFQDDKDKKEQCSRAHREV